MARIEIKQVIYNCDICEKEIKEIDVVELGVPILFTTNQTDGYPCEPYYTQEKLDFCKDCAEKATRIVGIGAQGYNQYHFKKGAE